MNALYWILWPAFLVAAVAMAFLVAAVGPQDVTVAGQDFSLSTLGTYSIEFLALWALAAASSLTTCILRRSGSDINHEGMHHPHDKNVCGSH